MELVKNKSLKNYNTFGIAAKAKAFIQVATAQEIKQVLQKYNPEELFVLGGGSNMLLLEDLNKTVLHVNLKGIREHSRTDSHVELDIMAGENWHDTVMYCVHRNYGGIENLSLIPGNVGTAPIQNIGAYGVELKDVFVSCKAIHRATAKEITFSLADCQFGYRDSFFKRAGKDQYIITQVRLKLSLNKHKLHTDYGAIQSELASKNISNPNISDISKAVIAIRESKLPNPAKIGNSGSFFKNPVVNKEKFNTFRLANPHAPFYKVNEQEYKIPAGWLIEQAGFKGFRQGDAGVHKNQALVLVNYGNAKGLEIWNLALQIQQKVKEKFNIELQPEVNIIGELP